MDTPRLTHVRANVSDLDRSIAGYEPVLGLKAEGHWPPDVPNYAHFQTGDTLFAIMVTDPVPAGGRFNFTVDDVDSWWGRLRDRADVVEPLFDTPYGTRKFTIKDPDGNELGFVRAA
jgi:predicted enzyme related to lactoylglutathione lyase